MHNAAASVSSNGLVSPQYIFKHKNIWKSKEIQKGQARSPAKRGLPSKIVKKLPNYCYLKFAMFSILGLVKSRPTMAFFDTLRVGGSRADTTLREKNCVSFH